MFLTAAVLHSQVHTLLDLLFLIYLIIFLNST